MAPNGATVRQAGQLALIIWGAKPSRDRISGAPIVGRPGVCGAASALCLERRLQGATGGGSGHKWIEGLCSGISDPLAGSKNLVKAIAGSPRIGNFFVPRWGTSQVCSKNPERARGFPETFDKVCHRIFFPETGNFARGVELYFANGHFRLARADFPILFFATPLFNQSSIKRARK